MFEKHNGRFTNGQAEAEFGRYKTRNLRNGVSELRDEMLNKGFLIVWETGETWEQNSWHLEPIKNATVQPPLFEGMEYAGH